MPRLESWFEMELQFRGMWSAFSTGPIPQSSAPPPASHNWGSHWNFQAPEKMSKGMKREHVLRDNVLSSPQTKHLTDLFLLQMDNQGRDKDGSLGEELQIPE